MLARIYEVTPPTEMNPEPELAKEVFHLSQAYLNPFVFRGRMHSAIALQGCIVLATMLSPFSREAFDLARNLPFDWFSRLLHRECGRVAEKWEGKAKPTILEQLRESLELLHNH